MASSGVSTKSNKTDKLNTDSRRTFTSFTAIVVPPKHLKGDTSGCGSIQISFKVRESAVLFQDTESRNQALEAQLSDLGQRLESSQQEREAFRKSLRSLLELLDSKIFELTELRDTLAKLLESSSS